MGISNTTKIVCDYTDKDGKACGKSFLLPDDPKLNTKGVEHTVSSTDAYGKILYFCGPLHMVAHWVNFIKATPQPKEEPAAPPPQAANVIPFSGKPAADLSLAELQDMGIIEPPADLNLEDNQ